MLAGPSHSPTSPDPGNRHPFTGRGPVADLTLSYPFDCNTFLGHMVHPRLHAFEVQSLNILTYPSHPKFLFSKACDLSNWDGMGLEKAAIDPMLRTGVCLFFGGFKPAPLPSPGISAPGRSYASEIFLGSETAMAPMGNMLGCTWYFMQTPKTR